MTSKREQASLDNHINTNAGIVIALDQIHTEGLPGATNDDLRYRIVINTGRRTGRDIVIDEMRILERRGIVKKTGVKQESGHLQTLYSLNRDISKFPVR